jgi:hypothetical protein
MVIAGYGRPGAHRNRCPSCLSLKAASVNIEQLILQPKGSWVVAALPPVGCRFVLGVRLSTKTVAQANVIRIHARIPKQPE